MAKKTKHKKTVHYYLQVYSIAVVAGLGVFLGGSFFSAPQLPCANSESCKKDYTLAINNSERGTYMGQTVIPPKIDLASEPQTTVLGTQDPKGPKHIYVDLSAQKLYAYEGDNKILEMLVSTGKWNPTPTGDFNIWLKLRATRMSGGEGADFYDLPNVPYTMFYYGDYGLHGAYWHNNFGHKMSHGCTNLRIVDARDLYNWADGPTRGSKGTPVSVCDSFTGPNTCVQKNPVN